MKALTAPRTALLLAVLVVAGWAVAQPLSFERGSTIKIEGTSNVHGWSCDVDQFASTVTGAATATTLTSLDALTVTVPTASIDCNNGTMNGKMREALGSSPVQFTMTRGTVGNAQNGRFPIQVAGRLTIKGSTQAVTFMAQGQPLGNGRFKVTGEVPVTMSQFGVRPPTAMMGAMRTGDRVAVKFDVTMNGGR